MDEMLELVLEEAGLLEEGWSVHPLGDLFVDPDGEYVELDSPRSPLRIAGLM